MQNLDVSKTVNAWSSLADTVFVPHTEAEYDRLVSLLDRLVDEVGEDESHPLASLMEIVGRTDRKVRRRARSGVVFRIVGSHIHVAVSTALKRPCGNQK